MSSLVRLLEKAVQARAPLRDNPATTAYRLVNGLGDGLADVTADLFEDVVVLSLYRAMAPTEEQELISALAKSVPARSIYLKRRPKEARVVANTQRLHVAPEAPALGEAVQELRAKEDGLQFLIRPGQGLSVGLYLDMRDIRHWVRERVQGTRVLNTFAYTCAFGIAATAGGASRAVNVDLSRRVLDWGEENARLNQQTVSRSDYVSGDVFEWLARFAKKDERFETVILDPPSFATAGKRRFSAASHYPELVESAVPLVERRGRLVACCNLASMSEKQFRAAVQHGLVRAGRKAKGMETLLPSPVDFPPAPGDAPALKVLVLELDV